MIGYSRKCHRPRTSSRHKEQRGGTEYGLSPACKDDNICLDLRFISGVVMEVPVAAWLVLEQTLLAQHPLMLFRCRIYYGFLAPCSRRGIGTM